MVRFRKKVLWVFLFILIDFSDTSDDSSNVMKLFQSERGYRQRPRSLLKYNAEKGIVQKKKIVFCVIVLIDWIY
jgi:hypothetical protein